MFSFIIIRLVGQDFFLKGLSISSLNLIRRMEDMSRAKTLMANKREPIRVL